MVNRLASSPPPEPFGRLPDGRTIELITLRNDSGVEVRVMTYGATIVSVRTPDRDGTIDDVVLGFATLEPYLGSSQYLGALVGRYANRIAGARFTLDGHEYRLATNDGPNHIHGGIHGWHRAVWLAAPFRQADRAGVTLASTSPDGDEGYPGTVTATVTYALTDAGALIADYQATTDQPTIINLTQHSYFNLAGGKAPDILRHEVMVKADLYTPIDAAFIPTGELARVEGTPLDCRQPIPVGDRIDDPHQQLRLANGYDHNFVLGRSGAKPRLAARLFDPLSGRTMEVATTEPGLQLYSGNFLDGSATGRDGRVYGPHAGLCLETQHYPDSPNHPHFPSAVLRPGEEFRSTTVFTFGVAYGTVPATVTLHGPTAEH